MKKLMVAAVTAAVFAAFADEPKPAAQNAEAQTEAEEAETEEDGAPLFWGFGSTGIYSGYQLYGDLLNSEPTWQTYAEGNINLPWDIGSVGVGIWLNSDLTDKRNGQYGKWFNEQDYNVHFDHQGLGARLPHRGRVVLLSPPPRAQSVHPVGEGTPRTLPVERLHDDDDGLEPLLRAEEPVRHALLQVGARVPREQGQPVPRRTQEDDRLN